MPEAATYNVYRYDDTNSVWVAEASGLTQPTWRHPFPPSAATHYVVTAANGDGESAPSNEVIISPVPADFIITTHEFHLSGQRW